MDLDPSAWWSQEPLAKTGEYTCALHDLLGHEPLAPPPVEEAGTQTVELTDAPNPENDETSPESETVSADSDEGSPEEDEPYPFTHPPGPYQSPPTPLPPP